MIYLKLRVIFPFCFPDSLFPFLSSRILAPSPPSLQSQGSLLPTPTPHLHSHCCLGSGLSSSLQDSGKLSPSLPISLLPAAERMVLLQRLVEMAFHFLEEEFQPPKHDIHYLHRGQELTPVVLSALSFPGRHCPSSLPGKLILIFLVTSPLRSTSLPWLATVKCFLSV